MSRTACFTRLAVPVDRLGPGYYLLTVSLSAASGAVEHSLRFQTQ